jgi:hypothetical protein
LVTWTVYRSYNRSNAVLNLYFSVYLNKNVTSNKLIRCIMFIPLVHTIQNIFYKQQSEKNPSHLVVRMGARYEIINVFAQIILIYRLV